MWMVSLFIVPEAFKRLTFEFLAGEDSLSRAPRSEALRRLPSLLPSSLRPDLVKVTASFKKMLKQDRTFVRYSNEKLIMGHFIHRVCGTFRAKFVIYRLNSAIWNKIPELYANTAS